PGRREFAGWTVRRSGRAPQTAAEPEYQIRFPRSRYAQPYQLIAPERERSTRSVKQKPAPQPAMSARHRGAPAPKNPPLSSPFAALKRAASRGGTRGMGGFSSPSEKIFRALHAKAWPSS